MEKTISKESVIFFPTSGKDRFRIYGLDINKRKHSEDTQERLEYTRELENQVKERTAELARINQELKAEIAGRQRTEEALRKLTDDLNERMKEANCLYSISYHVGRHHLPLKERLEAILKCIPAGWRYPEITCARILFEGVEYKTENYKETDWRESSDILIDGEKMGFVEVCYLEERLSSAEGPFLKEERNLINTIAIEIGEMIAHTRAEEAVKAERQRLHEALREASLYTRSLIEASLDPLVTISADGKVTDVNRATELATGIFRQQLIGTDFSDYFTEPERAKEGYRRVFRDGSVRDYPLAIRHTSGQVTDVLYNATVYTNESGEIQGVFAAARDVTARKRAQDALRESERQLRYFASQLLVAQENERKRVARELHDGIGQSLTAIKFKVESFLQEVRHSPMEVKAKPLKAIIPMIQEGAQEIRRIQQNLRPSMLDDLGILATLSWVCREFEATYSLVHIEKQIEIEEREVPDSLKLAIYRISQEALNNICKHSHADLVHLSFRKTEKAIEFSIQDNGHGFCFSRALSVEGPGKGLGLASMKERAEHSGGCFLVESAKGKGTIIRTSWPT